MHRTQIYLTEIERQNLNQLTRRTGKSKSELIREAIDQFVESKRYKKENKLEALRSVRGLWEKRTDLPDFIALRKEFDRRQD